MIYPATFEEKIGFDHIRQYIKSHCISDMGKEMVDELSYSSSFDEIERWLQETNEFKQVLSFEDPFPAQDYYDLREVLSRIRIEGTFIELDELAALRAFINAIIQICVYFKIRKEDNKFPRLWTICQDIMPEKGIVEAINKILDPKGQLRDNASDELRRIKSEINRISGEADRRIRKLLNAAKQDGIAKEDAEMTVRNGRLCIPVSAQFKRRLKGFVHDESATGQTVFIEPAEVFDANNEIKDLLNAQHREIIRILTEITNFIRPSIDNLLWGHQFIGHIDFIRAKALFAIDIDANLPHIFDHCTINWHNAIHPLLFLNFKGSGKKVQALDIKLSDDERILIISGPNAGGKSVCLKSIGLLQYMLQCGLLVSMADTSDMGIFQHFFIDMGDEQSIENDLSTYSSHLTNAKAMVENLDEKSLFLIDEFGSGTDPLPGGAMAEALLEAMYDKGAFGVITTHYGNLKLFPDTHKQAVNGAMMFDMTAMKPLFKLKMGKPGSSFTYEIARAIGLPQEIIDQAVNKTGTAQIDYEKKLEQIDNEKMEIDKMLRLVNSADDQLAQMITEYGEKFSELEKHRKDIIQKAKNQANSIIESANKVIEKTIREIKEHKADPNKTKQARQNISKLKEEFSKEIESIENEPALKPIVPIQKPKPQAKKQEIQEDNTLHVGDSVFMAETQIVGEVTQLNGDDITISFNSVSFRTTKSKVTKISKREARTVQRNGIKLDGGSLADAMNKKVAQFDSTMDMRGMRADEAIQALEPYLDEAVLLSIHQVKLLHGKGNGILRHVIRQYLAKRKEVKSFNDEALELGGSGITVVSL